MAKWIWFPGEYEIFHSNLLHSRRQEFGVDYPCFWSLSSNYPNINFSKKIDCKKDGKFVFYPNGIGYVIMDGRRYAHGIEIPYKAGTHDLKILVLNTSGLPAAFIEGDEIFTDESWSAFLPGTTDSYPVGYTDDYTKADDKVDVFPFKYLSISPVAQTQQCGGTLYDFGKETFAKLILKGVSSAVDAIYGESAEEALDEKHALIFEKNISADAELPPRAFRYIFLKGDAQPQSVSALYEYLHLEYKADFECDDPMIKNIFDVSAYTFHLNSREFFLDGIKRDRWVWSGDAYQSYMVNRYLFANNAITKRTITALLGKPPYTQHINTINDYSFYQMIGVWEYWFASGDLDFVKFIYPRLYELYSFCVSRLDENGFVVGRENDWVFIDWANLDKTGPMCAEQILLWRATICMKELADICGKECGCAIDTNELKEKIFDKFYRADRGGFVDGYVSGKELINRQQNVFAILYDFVSREQAELICEKVLDNDEIPQIKTPYFEFFELLALSKMGRIEKVQKKLGDYWGGMLKLGATSIWEQFDPTESGVQHYNMYGMPFGKSLCHAWGAGPIFILGRYIAGVETTAIGASQFKISPRPGIYKSFKARVPIGDDGYASVCYTGTSFVVKTNLSGGTFEYKNTSIDLEKDKEYIITI